MTIKKYLTTPEEILALKDTDTKIYVENAGGYYKFIQGTLFYFQNAGVDFEYQSSLWKSQNPYILVEEPVKEADENDIGYLCWFWDFDEKDKKIGVLVGLDEDSCPYRNGYTWYRHCRRATPAEVAEITGYKVEEENER